MSSIRRFLVVVLLATITLISFFAALHGYRTSMAEAEQLFDAQLSDTAAVLAIMAGTSKIAPALTDVTTGGTQNIVFQIWQGDELEVSAGIKGAASAAPIAPLQAGYSDVNFSGYRWRAFSRYVVPDDRWLVVAQRADIRFQLAEGVIIESVMPTILGLPLVGVLIWVIITRGLKPLRGLASEMGNKRSDDLSPVAEQDPPQELAILIGSINDLLRRLDAAFEREKRFAADAAHELRTPISVLKVQLYDLLLDSDRDDLMLQSLRASVERMERSVEQVLMLYSTAPEQFKARFEEFDLAATARQVIAELYPQIESRRQRIELIGDALPMRGDAFSIQTMLKNLIENASKYSGDGGEIRVKLESTPAAIMVTVEDSGPGIPVEQYDKVFERFYRVSRDRQDSSKPGSGIGLAIVQHVAEIHGATISLGESGFATGLAVIVSFPSGLPMRQQS